MTAPQRGLANNGSVLRRQIAFRHALKPALDPARVAIDPLAHV